MEQNQSKINLRCFLDAKETLIPNALKYTSLAQGTKKENATAQVQGTNSLVLTNNNQKLVLLCGGGSGHEPAHSGYVAPYVLSASVNGGVFASPSSGDVFKVIQNLSKNSSEILMIVKNYQGDKVTFGLAKLKTESAGEEIFAEGQKPKVRILVVGDDCGLIDRTQEGAIGEEWREEARGVAGTIFVYKILGYWARRWLESHEDSTHFTRYQALLGKQEEEAEASVDGLINLGEAIMSKGGLLSIGCCLRRCDLFGAPDNTSEDPDVPYGSIELGVGIHGEKGLKQIPYSGISSIIQEMVLSLKNSALKMDQDADLEAKEYVLMVNNLGAVSQLEMGCITQAALASLAENGLKVTHACQGTFMSSLNMNGFSLTLLHLKPELKEVILEALQHKTGTPFNIVDLSQCRSNLVDGAEEQEQEAEQAGEGGQQDLTYRVLDKLFAELRKHEADLNKWDKETGDGDLGDSVANVVDELSKLIKTSQFLQAKTLAQKLFLIGDSLSENMGGTSGPLYAAFVYGIAEVLNSKAEEAKGAGLSQVLKAALNNGNQKVSALGGAGFEERTMLYVLNKAYENWSFEGVDFSALGQQAAEANAELLAGLDKALTQYCAEVRDIAPTRGRSRYLKDRVLGLEDPGCELVRIWMTTLLRIWVEVSGSDEDQ